MTTKRFIVIEATGSCNHVAAHRAHELFCLATYLGMDPKWVRSWAWVGNPLPQDLLREGPAPAGVTQVEAGSFHPSLTGVMLKAVDDYVSSHPAIVEVVDREREEAGATQEALRRKVLQPDGAAPVDPCSVRAAQQPRGGSTSSNNQEQQRRQQQQQEHLQPQLGCSSCGKVKGDGVQLRSCTGCGGMAKYCSVECQRLDWPAHKTDCKAARGRVTQQARA
ncbi:hypothetical protein MNEG_6168 [Monoraphidium neglectum]|uniref:MYND-type domain-containing protein n=1 Tax=Monoraphidium neglectum TaxID=145388 RepID=A0A0D2JS16_9CHLO|nr:hypothetical protein MNEG_6168 [Monoraphidium neglectum]KIZ01793.1 hypothetical protein MNEG_6168 [Monoraphidium neglectum]|eukprot:XP_013900812.1 hypothetical protein MNEG_6168 [Monoraphidium neglectum]